MPSKRVLLTLGAIAIAAGATAVGAQTMTGPRGGDGQDHGGGGMGMMGDGGRHHGRWGWGSSVTKDQFAAKTRARFAEMDANSDGVVDANEIKAHIEGRMDQRKSRWGRRMGRGKGGRSFDRMMRRFDTDGDGKVTKVEFEAFVAERFTRMDLDGDGKITDADLPPMMRGRDILKGNANIGRGGRRGPGRFLRMVRGADTNNDGVITREEAMAAANKRFAWFDRNNDSVVDKADKDALRAEIVDYRVKRFFHRYGVSKEAKLTIEQFTKFREARFARMDTNKDGVLSRDEMPGRGGRWGRHHGGRHWGRHWGRERGGDERQYHRGGDDRSGPDGERQL